MTASIYNFHKKGRDALVDLIQEIHPRLGVQDDTVEFEEPFLGPTDAEPGRTFIEMKLLDQGLEIPFVYLRLNMATAMGDPIKINMNFATEVTPENIVRKINRVRGYNLNSRDVEMSRIPIWTQANPYTYTLKAKESSYVWYGETQVEITFSYLTGHERLLEDGSLRLMEEDSKPNYRLLQTAPEDV